MDHDYRYRFVITFSIFLLSFSITNQVHAQRERPLDAMAAQLEPTRTVVYKRVNDRKLRLFLFEPEGHITEASRPAVLVIHGGGWAGGKPRWMYTFSDYFAQQGLVGVSLEYRLMNAKAGTTVFDCVKDARSAMRYLRSHAKELGIDPDRITVLGASAGGHLAVSLSLFSDVNSSQDELSISTTPMAQILIYPVIDTSEAGYGMQKIGERWQELSPVRHIKKGMPPTLLFQGTADRVTPFAAAKSFVDKMEAHDNEIEFVTHEGGDHGYLIFDLQNYRKGLTTIDRFLNRYQ